MPFFGGACDMENNDYRRRSSSKTLDNLRELNDLIEELSKSCIDTTATSELLKVALFDSSVTNSFSNTKMANCFEILRHSLMNEIILFLHRAIDPHPTSRSLRRVLDIIKDSEIKRLMRRHCIAWEMDRGISRKDPNLHKEEFSSSVSRMKRTLSRESYKNMDQQITIMQSKVEKLINDGRLESTAYFRNSRIAHRTEKPRVLEKALERGCTINYPKIGDIF